MQKKEQKNNNLEDPAKRSRGRPAGIPNKTTQVSRECFAMLVSGNWHRMQEWLDVIAKDKKSGAKDAMDRMLAMAEFCVPKLARTELVNAEDATLKIQISRDANNTPASE